MLVLQALRWGRRLSVLYAALAGPPRTKAMSPVVSAPLDLLSIHLVEALVILVQLAARSPVPGSLFVTLVQLASSTL